MKAARITFLLGVLAVVVMWGLRLHRRHAHRNEWKRPLEVALVLVSSSPASGSARSAGSTWEDGAERLESWFGGELQRWRPGSAASIHWRLFGPISSAEPLSLGPPSDGWVDRASYTWRATRQLSAIDAQAGIAERGYDARIYVLLEPRSGDAARFVEGVAEAGGEVGVVRGVAGDDDISLELTACAHELLHCLGASDKYDAEGHATAAGIVEPEAAPRFPQRYAEPMVGEVPLGPANGRLPRSLAEVRIGPVTASEVGWTL